MEVPNKNHSLSHTLPGLHSPYYSTYWCYIHQTCTNCSSWHDILMRRGGLCLWPTFHAWVTMVRKKWLSLYYSTYWCYIHQTCTNCSSWHDLLMRCGGLCPWPTFHAWVTMVRKKWLSLYYSTYWSYIHQTYTVHLDMIYWIKVWCQWWFVFLTYISRFSDQDTIWQQRAPVMVPITIMSSLY